MKRFLALSLALLLIAAVLGGCQGKPAAVQNSAATETPAEPVTLTLTGSWPDLRAIDEIGKLFTKQYPNCSIVYEYVQDYYPSLEKRMAGEDPIDLFTTSNIQEGDPMLPFAVDLNACENLDLSQTFEGLIQNFTFRSDADETPKLYAVPLGAEMRGLYVNKTLLAACETLRQNGYIAFHGNPGEFSQVLLYPWICNIVANAADAKAVYAKIDAREPGIAELFREPLQFLYAIMESGYYDYKKAQTDLSLFLDTKDEAYARDFLNIVSKGDSWEKLDDIGRVAFMPSPMSLENVIAKVKDDYHSEIEYVFVPAPVGPEGGYAYLSPAHGIAICKHSKNIEWAEKFLDFLFKPENNEVFAKAFNVIPNTKESFSYISERFDVPDDRISHLGEVTFHYDFYNTIKAGMTEISKANNPKYMLDDGAGNLSLKSLDAFMADIENSFIPQ